MRPKAHFNHSSTLKGLDSSRIWIPQEEPSGAITTLKDLWKCLLGTLCASGNPTPFRDVLKFSSLKESIAVVGGGWQAQGWVGEAQELLWPVAHEGVFGLPGVFARCCLLTLGRP